MRKYNRHGITCFDFKKDEKGNKLMFVLAVFGWSEIKDFLSSFKFFHISLSYVNNFTNVEIVSDDIDITETLVDKNEISCLKSSQDRLNKLIVGGASCSFESVRNFGNKIHLLWKPEPKLQCFGLDMAIVRYYQMIFIHIHFVV